MPEISDEMLSDAYSAIKDFILCYDADSIMMALESLDEYHLSDYDRKKADDIRDALSTLDWECLRSIMQM